MTISTPIACVAGRLKQVCCLLNTFPPDMIVNPLNCRIPSDSLGFAKPAICRWGHRSVSGSNQVVGQCVNGGPRLRRNVYLVGHGCCMRTSP
jgi:hypothetical protein